MKIENISTSNWENAFRGMRNPYDSWGKSDSEFGFIFSNDLEDIKYQLENHKIEIIRQDLETNISEYAAICPKDIELAQKLIKGGPVHSKFLRQIFISMDITAPFYLHKELDTYKVATVENSCSTMHTIQNYPIDITSFEIDDLPENFEDLEFAKKEIIPWLENLRTKYLELKEKSWNTEDPEKADYLMKESKKYWKELIRWLPEGWLQKRTWTGNYETARNILKWREPHKLIEWVPICDALKSLPFANELLTFGL